MNEQRFYVREHSGYHMKPSGVTAGNANTITDVMVIDRDFSHNIACSYPHPRRGPQYLSIRRNRAENKCRELNEWHEAAMRA